MSAYFTSSIFVVRGRTIVAALCLCIGLCVNAKEKQNRLPILSDFPKVAEAGGRGWFDLSSASIIWDAADEPVVGIAAGMLADDVQRVTGKRPEIAAVDAISRTSCLPAVVAGTLGHSRIIDSLVANGLLDVSQIMGKWESFLVVTLRDKGRPMLVIVGSDRRGTAYGLTSLSGAIGVSPWYWWADVVPQHKDALYVEPGCFIQGEPSVQYRGIFINDERFGGWALWVERNFDKQTGKVGPKVYEKVFELLLRLKGNLLWPAMHNGSQAFNADPENARLADRYAIVMGSSHCEQMLRNNEDEWKNAGTWGDFNYITNRDNMIRYWEERVQANGQYENIYTLGLRGIHDYPMEGANTTAERVALMQKAVNDQRDILRRNVSQAVESVPQVLCTYEEVLDAYHNGLQIPDDVTLLWSDDKHGYTRNLCNPEEMGHKGGAGIYYHISYHGDPASWIWLSPLSPAFISTELTKAYTYGARKIWVFNVGDIKPAEKEISFAMDLAWDIERWNPENAHNYIKEWTGAIFGEEIGEEISDIQRIYYQLMASGKDSHVWFVDYSESEIRSRLARWYEIERRALDLENCIPDSLKAAYFELILYPVKGASMLNRYQLLSRCSMAHAAVADEAQSMKDASLAMEAFNELNEWTSRYNEDLLDGKWREFFSWQPYHWHRSKKMDAPVSTEELLDKVGQSPAARFIDPVEALTEQGACIVAEVEGDIPVWMEALSPIRNFSKAAADNVFCHVTVCDQAFDASATPINNIWHAHYVGPMWSKVGTVHLKKGENYLKVTQLKEDARIDGIWLGVWPPFQEEAYSITPAAMFDAHHDSNEGKIEIIPWLGFADGVLVQPFDTPSYDDVAEAPYVEYELNLPVSDGRIEVRTLADLHVYEGREIRYAVQVDDNLPEVFSIHTDDFSAEWRKNVLRGYSCRSVDVTAQEAGRHRVRIYFMDPGVVIQEICVYSAK